MKGHSPLLAVLPGRLRDWAASAIAIPNDVVVHDLGAEPRPVLPDDVPAAVLLDDPASAISDLMTAGFSALEATRNLTVVLAGTFDPSWPAACHVLARTAAEAAATLGQRVRTALRLAGDQTETPALPAIQRPADALAIALAEGFAGPLQARAAGTQRAPLRWPRTCFLHGDPPHNMAPDRLELVGPARILLYGPYLYLPAGQWEAELRFYFSQQACRRTFTVDMVTQDIIGTIRLRPTDPGTFLARMMFQHVHADRPVELRVMLDHGAIEGRIGLESVTLYQPESGFVSGRL